MSNYQSRVFEKELLLDILDDNAEGFETISNEIGDRRRWVVSYYLVFRELATGTVYGVCYDVGATEYQDQSPWEYDGDKITVFLLKPFERTIIEYLPVLVEN